MAEFASHGVANAGLTTGIIGTALGVLNGGLGLLNGNGRGIFNYGYGPVPCDTPRFVTKDELNYVQELGKKDSEIALLKSEQNTEVKIADVYERLITRINADRREQDAWNASQSVANTQMSAAIATNTASISALNNTLSCITKTVVPITAVCPEPMPLKNSWTAPTSTPSA